MILEKSETTYQFQAPRKFSDEDSVVVVREPNRFDSWVVAILDAKTQKLRDEVVAALREHEVMTENGDTIQLLDDSGFRFKQKLEKMISRELAPVESEGKEAVENVDYNFRGTKTAEELTIPVDKAEEVVRAFLDNGGIANEDNSNIGLEQGVVFFNYEDVDYAIKLTGDETIEIQLQRQKLLMDNGVTQLAPLTLVEIEEDEVFTSVQASSVMAEMFGGPREYLVQRKVKQITPNHERVAKEMKEQGIEIRDPKSNIFMHEGSDGVARPILFDFGGVWLSGKT